MARLSKTPGVELMRFERGDERLAYFSKGMVLRNVRRKPDGWYGWKRYEAWKLGTLTEVRKEREDAGWQKVSEFTG